MLFTTETDYSIRFTNDTPRQAANAPDAFEQEALAAFNADPDRKAFWRVVDAGDGTRVFRYTEPLYVTESCLECHGDPVGELDQYGYPKEGMQVGQVGGAMSITEPMGIYAAGIQDSMMQQAIMVLFMMVAAFIGLYFVTSRLVLRPIDELRGAAGAVGKGDFNYTLTVPDPGEPAPRRAWRSSPASSTAWPATLRRFMRSGGPGAFQDRRPHGAQRPC